MGCTKGYTQPVQGAPQLVNGTYVRTVREISCTKTESPTVVGEWYVCTVTKISYMKTENPILVAEWYVRTVMKISSIYENGNTSQKFLSHAALW